MVADGLGLVAVTYTTTGVVEGWIAEVELAGGTGLLGTGLGGTAVLVGGKVGAATVMLGCVGGGWLGLLPPSASANERPPTTSTTETNA